MHWWTRHVANSSYATEHPQGVQPKALRLLVVRFLQCSWICSIQHGRKHCDNFGHALQLSQVNESHETWLEVMTIEQSMTPMISFFARFMFKIMIWISFLRTLESIWKDIGNCWRLWLEVEQEPEIFVKENLKIESLLSGNDFCSDICYQKNASQWINDVQEKSLIQSLRYLRDTSPR